MFTTVKDNFMKNLLIDLNKYFLQLVCIYNYTFLSLFTFFEATLSSFFKFCIFFIWINLTSSLGFFSKSKVFSFKVHLNYCG